MPPLLLVFHNYQLFDWRSSINTSALYIRVFSLRNRLNNTEFEIAFTWSPIDGKRQWRLVGRLVLLLFYFKYLVSCGRISSVTPSLTYSQGPVTYDGNAFNKVPKIHVCWSFSHAILSADNYKQLLVGCLRNLRSNKLVSLAYSFNWEHARHGPEARGAGVAQIMLRKMWSFQEIDVLQATLVSKISINEIQIAYRKSRFNLPSRAVSTS